jgi:predicted transcriptional regulator
MVTKDAVLSILSKMPDDIDLDEIQYQLYVLESVQKGLTQIDSGEALSHDEARSELSEWLD